MRRLLLPRVAAMGVEGMVEGLAIDVLRVLRKDVLEIFGQVGVAVIGHLTDLDQAPAISLTMASAAAAGSAARVIGRPTTI